MEVELRDEVGPGLVEVDRALEQLVERARLRHRVEHDAVDAHFYRDRVHHS